jgi:hypothetical protein
MGNEIELKFEVAPRELRKLKVVRYSRGRPPKEENLVSVYFDTPKHKLARNSVSLRVRHHGDKFVQTIKSGESNGSFKRGEWEHEIKGDVPNLRKAHGTPLAPLLTKKLKRTLKPIFETHIHRTSLPICKNGSRIEVALDEGEVRVARQSAPISELELELKRGKVADVFKLAREIGKVTPATLLLKSKSERGYDLIADTPAKTVRAVADALEGELRDDAEASRATAEHAPEQAAPVLGGWATNGAQRSVGRVDLELDDVVKRQPVAPDQVAIPSGLCVSADSDVGTLSVRDGDPVSLELGGDVRQQHAGIDPGHGLPARSLDLQVLEALHAEQNRVFATRGEPAVLMTAAASHEVLLVGFGKPDRSGDVIAVPSRNSD